jgi:hypothetical protein
MHVIGLATVPWDAGTVVVGTRMVRRRAGLRLAQAPSSRGVLVALVFSALAVFLLLPMAMGWHHTTVSRHLVLWWGRDLAGGGRLEAKFMYEADLPSVQLHPSLFTMSAGEGYWVVASSSPDLFVGIGCAGDSCPPPKPVWSLAYVPDEAPFLAVPVAGAAKGTTEARWPAVFDRLPDRAGPNWWPVVPPRVAAAPLAVASALLGAAAIWRGRHVSGESA